MAKDVPLVVQGIISGAGGASSNATRQAHFLLPRGERGHLPAPPPPPCDVRPVRPGELRVEFKGWPVAPELWKWWADKLRQRHEHLWRNAGIFHAIVATTHSVAERDDAALLQLAAFWSGEANTFVFPWGEATVTLEDVAVLAGLPLLGEPVCKNLYGGDRGDVTALEAVRSSLCKNSWTSRPSHAAWAKHFSELLWPEDEVLEHEGFLAMWLSLFVLPAPPRDEVRPEVLPVAARLARGGAVALAPAALASIYADLSALRRHIVSSSASDERPPSELTFEAWAPLHVLQLWVWEHFPELRPEAAARATPPRDIPRAIRRWHGARRVSSDPRYVHAVLMSPASFEWAPYGSSGLAPPPGHYDRREIARRGELRSFAHCLRACELVGMGGAVEHYSPHRVARQLGYDQDVPGAGAKKNSDWSVAWAKYKIGLVKFSFVVPGNETAAVTTTAEYEQWWEPCSRACAAAVAEAARVKVAALSSQIAGDGNGLMPGWVRSGAKRTPLRIGKNVSQGSSISATATALLASAVGEPSASVTEKERSKSLQQPSEEDAPQPVTTPNEQNNITEQVQQVQAHRLVPQTQSGAATSSLLNPSEERQPVSAGNSEQSNTVSQAERVQNSCVSELAAALQDLNLQQVPADIVAAAADLLLGPTQETRPRAVTGEMGTSTHQMESRMKYLAEASTNTSGNGEMSSSNPVMNVDSLQRYCVSQIAATLKNPNLQQEHAVTMDDGLLQKPAEKTPNPAVTRKMSKRAPKGKFSLLDGNNKGTGNNISSPNNQQMERTEANKKGSGEMGKPTQQMESLMKYLAEASNLSGNGEMSSSNPVSEIVDRVQKYCASQLDAILNDLTLQQEQAEGVATVRTDAGLLQKPTEKPPTRAVTKKMSKRAFKGKFSSQGCNKKGNSSNISSPNNQKKMECEEANKKRSGNGGTSSSTSRLDDGENTAAQDNTEVCTKTLYYLSRNDRTEEAWANDAKDPTQPKRAVGTMEMIKKASAIRQAEIAELMKKIPKLVEEILEMEAAEEQQ